MKRYSNYHRRIIARRVFTFLETAGFTKQGENNIFCLEINRLAFRVELVDGSYHFYVRTSEGELIKDFPFSVSFSGEFRNEKEIGLHIINWVYETAYRMGTTNREKQFNLKLQELIANFS